MKCPTCQTELKRILYEGMGVFRCFGCAGYLMQEKRLEAIRRAPSTWIPLLMQEVVDESKPDTTKKIKCPRCFYPMRKIKLKSPASLMLDVCNDCNHIWFDGGELARIQLAYESSDFGREQLELRRRFESLTPEERTNLQRRINRLQKMNPGGLSEDDRQAIAVCQFLIW